MLVCLVCGFMSKSTAMVMSRRSIKLTTLFLGKLDLGVNKYIVHKLPFVTDTNLCLESAEGGE